MGLELGCSLVLHVSTGSQLSALTLNIACSFSLLEIQIFGASVFKLLDRVL